MVLVSGLRKTRIVSSNCCAPTDQDCRNQSRRIICQNLLIATLLKELLAKRCTDALRCQSDQDGQGEFNQVERTRMSNSKQHRYAFLASREYFDYNKNHVIQSRPRRLFLCSSASSPDAATLCFQPWKEFPLSLHQRPKSPLLHPSSCQSSAFACGSS